MSISVLVSIQHRFAGRILEWYVATQLLMWGIILLAPAESFTASGAFADFPIPEERFGIIMLLLGIIRLGALIVNGAVPNVTPLVRVGGAFLGCGVWFYISMNLSASGHLGTWIAAWPLAFIAEFINMNRAAKDARVGLGRHMYMRAHGEQH